MADQPAKSGAAHHTAALATTTPQADQGLAMAEMSRLSVLSPPGASGPASMTPGHTLSGTVGPDPLLRDPLATLPPHVTHEAAAKSYPPAIHGVDRQGVPD